MLVDICAVLFLVLLEGLLSFDNALALAAMVRYLPKWQQRKALTYGMAGAFAFRLLALSIVTYLMQATWVKVAGGGYLLWMAIKYFLQKQQSQGEAEGLSTSNAFWKIIIAVELTDIAFSMDSILAAVAVSSKLWVVVTGGVFGIIAMRFVANLFIGLIERFPQLERSAFLLVACIGVKLLLEACEVYFGWTWFDFDSTDSPALWALWTSMALSLFSGFTVDRKKNPPVYVVGLKKQSE